MSGHTPWRDIRHKKDDAMREYRERLIADGFTRVVPGPKPSHEDIDRLATYNAERARGLVHTVGWGAEMAALQAEFDAWQCAGYSEVIQLVNGCGGVEETWVKGDARCGATDPSLELMHEEAPYALPVVPPCSRMAGHVGWHVAIDSDGSTLAEW